MSELVSVWKSSAYNKTIKLYQHGKNDYSVFYVEDDCSIRGTLLDILKEISCDYHDIILFNEKKEEK